VSRAFTAEEVRANLFEMLAALINEWETADLTRPEFVRAIAKTGKSELHYRLDGLVFSILNMFDGGCGFMPSFNLTVDPHPDDRAFHEQRGEDYYESISISDTSLHEMWIMRHQRPR
jgi:hypothetical protein